ncbi:MAG: magnesium transporter, partial [Oscillospiraceae bacterium]|nr:magnesium transporter [Oscillospiraceae bacterium]
MAEEKQGLAVAAETEAAVASIPDYESEIIKIIRGNSSPKIMQNLLEDYHGKDIAEVMDSLSLAERKKLYRVCTVDLL